jgi:hypothetical protein
MSPGTYLGRGSRAAGSNLVTPPIKPPSALPRASAFNYGYTHMRRLVKCLDAIWSHRPSRVSQPPRTRKWSFMVAKRRSLRGGGAGWERGGWKGSGEELGRHAGSGAPSELGRERLQQELRICPAVQRNGRSSKRAPEPNECSGGAHTRKRFSSSSRTTLSCMSSKASMKLPIWGWVARWGGAGPMSFFRRQQAAVGDGSSAGGGGNGPKPKP